MKTNENNRNAVVQTTLRVCEHGNDTIVVSDRGVQTITATSPTVDNQAVIPFLEFIPYSEIEKDSQRVVDLPRKALLQFDFERKTRRRNTVEDLTPKSALKKSQSQIDLENESNILSQSPFPKLFKTMEEQEAQTDLTVNPYILDEDAVANVCTQLSVQTSITFDPADSLSEITNTLKKVRRHTKNFQAIVIDGKLVTDYVDPNADNDSKHSDRDEEDAERIQTIHSVTPFDEPAPADHLSPDPSHSQEPSASTEAPSKAGQPSASLYMTEEEFEANVQKILDKTVKNVYEFMAKIVEMYEASKEAPHEEAADSKDDNAGSQSATQRTLFPPVKEENEETGEEQQPSSQETATAKSETEEISPVSASTADEPHNEEISPKSDESLHTPEHKSSIMQIVTGLIRGPKWAIQQTLKIDTETGMPAAEKEFPHKDETLVEDSRAAIKFIPIDSKEVEERFVHKEAVAEERTTELGDEDETQTAVKTSDSSKEPQGNADADVKGTNEEISEAYPEAPPPSVADGDINVNESAGQVESTSPVDESVSAEPTEEVPTAFEETSKGEITSPGEEPSVPAEETAVDEMTTPLEGPSPEESPPVEPEFPTEESPLVEPELPTEESPLAETVPGETPESPQDVVGDTRETPTVDDIPCECSKIHEGGAAPPALSQPSPQPETSIKFEVTVLNEGSIKQKVTQGVIVQASVSRSEQKKDGNDGRDVINFSVVVGTQKTVSPNEDLAIEDVEDIGICTCSADLEHLKQSARQLEDESHVLGSQDFEECACDDEVPEVPPVPDKPCEPTPDLASKSTDHEFVVCTCASEKTITEPKGEPESAPEPQQETVPPAEPAKSETQSVASKTSSSANVKPPEEGEKEASVGESQPKLSASVKREEEEDVEACSCKTSRSASVHAGPSKSKPSFGSGKQSKVTIVLPPESSKSKEKPQSAKPSGDQANVVACNGRERVSVCQADSLKQSEVEIKPPTEYLEQSELMPNQPMSLENQSKGTPATQSASRGTIDCCICKRAKSERNICACEPKKTSQQKQSKDDATVVVISHEILECGCKELEVKVIEDAGSVIVKPQSQTKPECSCGKKESTHRSKEVVAVKSESHDILECRCKRPKSPPTKKPVCTCGEAARDSEKLESELLECGCKREKPKPPPEKSYDTLECGCRRPKPPPTNKPVCTCGGTSGDSEKPPPQKPACTCTKRESYEILECGCRKPRSRSIPEPSAATTSKRPVCSCNARSTSEPPSTAKPGLDEPLPCGCKKPKSEKVTEMREKSPPEKEPCECGRKSRSTTTEHVDKIKSEPTLPQKRSLSHKETQRDICACKAKVSKSSSQQISEPDRMWPYEPPPKKRIDQRFSLPSQNVCPCDERNKKTQSECPCGPERKANLYKQSIENYIQKLIHDSFNARDPELIQKHAACVQKIANDFAEEGISGRAIKCTGDATQQCSCSVEVLFMKDGLGTEDKSCACSFPRDKKPAKEDADSKQPTTVKSCNCDLENEPTPNLECMYEGEDDYNEMYMEELESGDFFRLEMTESEKELCLCKEDELPEVVTETDRCGSKIEMPWLSIALPPPGTFEIKSTKEPNQYCECWRLDLKDSVLSATEAVGSKDKDVKKPQEQESSAQPPEPESTVAEKLYEREANSSDDSSSGCSCSDTGVDECDDVQLTSMNFVYDNPCFAQYEPYMDPMYKLFPDDCDTYCGPFTEIHWSDILIPKKVKLRETKKPTTRPPQKSSVVTLTQDRVDKTVQLPSEQEKGGATVSELEIELSFAQIASTVIKVEGGAASQQTVSEISTISDFRMQIKRCPKDYVVALLADGLPLNPMDGLPRVGSQPFSITQTIPDRITGIMVAVEPLNSCMFADQPPTMQPSKDEEKTPPKSASAPNMSIDTLTSLEFTENYPRAMHRPTAEDYDQSEKVVTVQDLVGPVKECLPCRTPVKDQQPPKVIQKNVPKKIEASPKPSQTPGAIKENESTFTVKSEEFRRKYNIPPPMYEDPQCAGLYTIAVPQMEPRVFDIDTMLAKNRKLTCQDSTSTAQTSPSKPVETKPRDKLCPSCKRMEETSSKTCKTTCKAKAAQAAMDTETLEPPKKEEPKPIAKPEKVCSGPCAKIVREVINVQEITRKEMESINDAIENIKAKLRGMDIPELENWTSSNLSDDCFCGYCFPSPSQLPSQQARYLPQFSQLPSTRQYPPSGSYFTNPYAQRSKQAPKSRHPHVELPPQGPYSVNPHMRSVKQSSDSHTPRKTLPPQGPYSVNPNMPSVKKSSHSESSIVELPPQGPYSVNPNMITVKRSSDSHTPRKTLPPQGPYSVNPNMPSVKKSSHSQSSIVELPPQGPYSVNPNMITVKRNSDSRSSPVELPPQGPYSVNPNMRSVKKSSHSQRPIVELPPQGPFSVNPNMPTVRRSLDSSASHVELPPQGPYSVNPNMRTIKKSLDSRGVNRKLPPQGPYSVNPNMPTVKQSSDSRSTRVDLPPQGPYSVNPNMRSVKQSSNSRPQRKELPPQGPYSVNPNMRTVKESSDSRSARVELPPQGPYSVNPSMRTAKQSTHSNSASVELPPQGPYSVNPQMRTMKQSSQLPQLPQQTAFRLNPHLMPSSHLTSQLQPQSLPSYQYPQSSLAPMFSPAHLPKQYPYCGAPDYSMYGTAPSYSSYYPYLESEGTDDFTDYVCSCTQRRSTHRRRKRRKLPVSSSDYSCISTASSGSRSSITARQRPVKSTSEVSFSYEGRSDHSKVDTSNYSDYTQTDTEPEVEIRVGRGTPKIKTRNNFKGVVTKDPSGKCKFRVAVKLSPSRLGLMKRQDDSDGSSSCGRTT